MQKIGDVRTEAESGAKPRRPSLRRPARPAVVRPGYVRSEVRRGPQASLQRLLPVQRPPLSTGEHYERVMTLRLQAVIAAAMVGMSLFFHAPLKAALLNLFS